MRGGGDCGVSANEHSCAHHVTWSPNKLWRSTSIFNLWCTHFQCILYIKDKRGHWTGQWTGHLPVGEDIEEIVEVTVEEHALGDARLVEEAVAGERVLEHVDLSRPPEGPRELRLQFPDVN